MFPQKCVAFSGLDRKSPEGHLGKLDEVEWVNAEWMDAVRALTQQAYEQAPGYWPDFNQLMADAGIKPESVAHKKRQPNLAYAYSLCACIRTHKLLPTIPAIIRENELIAQFTNPSPEAVDELNKGEDDPSPRDEEFTIPEALLLRGVDRAIEFCGRYHLIIRGRPDQFAVYLCHLRKKLGKDGTPRFSMWREASDGSYRVYQGGYFVNDDHLYMLGGRPEALDLRMAVLRVNSGVGEEDFEGVALFVNSQNTIMSSRAYLRKTHKIRFEKLPKSLISEDALKEFDPDAHAYLVTSHPLITQESLFE